VVKGLEPGLNTEVLEAILEESEKKEPAELGAYLHAVLEANAKIVKEVTGMGKKRLTLHDVLEESGMTAEWEERGRGQSVVQGGKAAWERAIDLLKQGYTVEQLEQMDPFNAPQPTNP
jgi:hypothetical protein